MHVLNKGEKIGLLTCDNYQEVESVKCKVNLKCECGREVFVTLMNARSGNTRSCGCAKKKHGKSKSEEYNSWLSMKQRCLNPKASGYHRYGGRGISIVKEWIESFDVFFNDMGSRPDGFSLERIDSNGDYEPKNCKWASPKSQARNRCDNRFITAFGREMLFSEAAIEFNISKGCLAARLKKMSAEEALTAPLSKRRPRK